jgi:alkylhydroperoxidase family enzyme
LDPSLVEAVLSQGIDAPVEKELKSALTLIEKFTLRPNELSPDDIHAARAAGLTDRAIEDAFYVATLFNVQDRLADAFGFHVPKRLIERGAPIVYRYGYRFLTFV